MEKGEVLGRVWEASVLADGIVADHRRRRLAHHRRIVSVTVAALRPLKRLLRAAVEPVALEVSDRFDDRRQVAPRHGVTAHPTNWIVRRADGHLKHTPHVHSATNMKHPTS